MITKRDAYSAFDKAVLGRKDLIGGARNQAKKATRQGQHIQGEAEHGPKSERVHKRQTGNDDSKVRELSLSTQTSLDLSV